MKCRRTDGQSRTALVAIAFALVTSTSEARTWHIHANRTGDAPTNQAGIDSAAAGDSVLVTGGTYHENLDTHEKRISLVGEGGIVEPIVDGGFRARVLTLSGGGVVVGFTFRNGHASSGGGVWIGGPARAIVRSNIIENNLADFGPGGGVFVASDAPNSLLEFNTIRYNVSGSSGGGIYDESS